MKKVFVVLAVLMFVSSLAYGAESCKVCGALKSDNVASVCTSRIGNGLANALFGWTEIFFRPGKVVAAGGNPIVGFFRGLGNAVTRTAAGAIEVATFWTPGDSVMTMDDCPLCAYK